MLLIIHPKGISEATQFAVDQFVLRGGKLIAFLDPLAALDRSAGVRELAPDRQTLKAWGVTFETRRFWPTWTSSPGPARAPPPRCSR